MIVDSITTSTGVSFVETAQERREFLEFPYRLYKDHPFWVPPLRIQQKKLIDTKKNPFYKNAEIALFLGTHNGKTAGRIAAIIDHRYNDYHKTKTGFFGFFDCADHQDLASLLIKAASDWLRDRGMTSLLGPTNPGMMDTIGVLVEGFDSIPAILMPYNDSSYDRLLTTAGLQKEMDLFSFIVNAETVDLDRVNRAREIVYTRNPGLSVRPINLKRIFDEVDIIRDIFNQAWQHNWGFIPLSKEEFVELAKDLKSIIDPDLAYIAEIDGKPVAFTVPLPDYNQIFHKMNGNLLPFGIFKLLLGRNKMTNIRTTLMGVLPEYRGRGIDAVLHQHEIEKGLKKGYFSSELGWVLENNIEMVRVAERIGSHSKKVYRMYGSSLV